MKEKQTPSQPGLAAAATSKSSSRGVAAGNHLSSEVPGTLLPLILLWPPDPEGCMCNLEFTHILPGRKDSDGSEELHSLQALHAFRSSAGAHSMLLLSFIGVSCLVLPSCSFYLLMLPPSHLLVTLCCPDWTCESNTATAMPSPPLVSLLSWLGQVISK